MTLQGHFQFEGQRKCFNMKINKHSKCSLFEPIKTFFFWSQFIGFPLKPVNDNEFTFNKLSYFGLIFIALLTGLGMDLALVAMTAYGVSPFFYVNELVKHGMSVTEASFAMLTYLPSSNCFIFYFPLLKRTKDLLNKFCTEFYSLQNSIQISKEKLRKLFRNFFTYRMIISIIPLIGKLLR